MADIPVADSDGKSRARPGFHSIRDFAALVRRRRLFMLGTVVGLLALCLLYCLIAPNQYEASARVALRMQPASSLSLETAAAMAPVSILSTPLQLETLVNVLRSEQLRWRVITGLKLYQSSAFSKGFADRFPRFDPLQPGPEAESYLLDRFDRRLQVRALPRTLLIEIRFRCKDPALAAAVVNALIHDFGALERESRRDATQDSSAWLEAQLSTLTANVEAKEKQLGEFERGHGFLVEQQSVSGSQPMETLHDPRIMQVDEAARLLAAATGDRVLHEALYRQAQQGSPEQVLAANPDLQAEMGPGGATLAQQLRTRLSDTAVELAQLQAEHGPNYPRVVELTRAGQDIQAQINAEDANLTEAFARTWKAAADREQLLQQQLDARLAEGVKQDDATIQYAVLHGEVQSGRELCTRLQRRLQEAGLSAGLQGSSITVVDPAREPFKPVTPDWGLYLAITLFVSLWLALGGALLLDTLHMNGRRFASAAPCLLAGLIVSSLTLAGPGTQRAYAQAPTPNTSGLPSGVVRLPSEAPANNQTSPPNPREAPPVWNAPATSPNPTDPGPRSPAASAMALPIAAGDSLEISEFHTPEFRSAVRVAADGTVALPLVGEVKLLGMSEQQAAAKIAKALLDGGMLLHPQVSVLVTEAVGQDVSVIGEVTRPGVYPYTVHHRLLDLIASASGLAPNAGRLVNIFHREDPRTPHPVVLNATGVAPKTAQRSSLPGRNSLPGLGKNPKTGVDADPDPNPELAPGDTVEVSRAGLVYVVGDVVRPGGFAVDPVQGLTVVQALSLAWGSTPNASVGKAILIRDQPGGRTLTTLNLKRMIRGQDPDEPVRDRDILFVPDSTAKTLMNRTLESAIQSAIGVTIYAGLVYSQRF